MRFRRIGFRHYAPIQGKEALEPLLEIAVLDRHGECCIKLQSHRSGSGCATTKQRSVCQPSHRNHSAASPQAAYCAPGTMGPSTQLPIDWSSIPVTGTSSAANRSLDGADMLSRYGYQTDALEAAESQRWHLAPIAPPADGEAIHQQMWWVDRVTKPSSDQPSVYFGIQQLIDGAVLHSSHIRVLSTEPSIRRTEVIEEMAQFNWRRFLETRYDDRNDPIGNTLTTGNNSSRFTQQQSTLEGGLKQKNVYGGELELSQNLQVMRNNSRFTVPNPQGTARLELQYTQPLWSGAGRAVNESRIVLAQIGVGTADDQWFVDVQDHLMMVSEAYWSLYSARAEYVQRKQLLTMTEQVLQTLRAREDFDSQQRQILRAQSAIASRQSEIIRAAAAIKDAESRLRLLVNDPALLSIAGLELTPMEAPSEFPLQMSMGDALKTALANRRDVSQAIREVRAAGVRAGVAKNQLLPKLDMMFSTYVAGLQDNGNAINAFGNQFIDGRPGMAAGFIYEAPVGNQGAQARAERSRLEIIRALAAFDWTVQQGLTSAEMAMRKVQTTQQEIIARKLALQAAVNEAAYLYDRWLNVPGLDASAVLLLEDLLDAQARVTDEERALVTAQVDYALAVIKLKREMGTLLRINLGE